MQPQQQQEQRRQSGSSSGGGAAGRSLVNPFAMPSGGYQHQTQQPPQQSSFLQYPVSIESSIRSYNQQQQQMSGRYWQTPTGVESSSSSSGKQRQHGGSLDLGEFSDILDTNSARSGGEAPGGMSASEAASETSMASFEAHSFHDGMTGPTRGAGVGSSAGLQSAPLATGSTGKGSAASKATTRVIPASADPETMALVDAAYMPFSEASAELDLTTEKLPKDRKERCQFLDCPNRARVSQSYGKFCNRHVIVAPCGFPGCRDRAMERAAIMTKVAGIAADTRSY
ncbi:hypothetical protein PR001_g17850 [Phytophthora rubi]|uniref:Uncharacterized protein n=1 Tax=Phytophthora rubi TaxID=129364 RepID=A0A6A3KGL9_9STRA|nr:hypothetical protein PR001_g17850 [Phytophthora rubi]